MTISRQEAVLPRKYVHFKMLRWSINIYTTRRMISFNAILSGMLSCLCCPGMIGLQRRASLRATFCGHQLDMVSVSFTAHLDISRHLEFVERFARYHELSNRNLLHQ